MRNRRRFIEFLKKTSFQAMPEPVFRLSSGKHSKYYIDCKQILSYPEARRLIAELIYERIADCSFDAIGGLEIGAYPIATSVSDIIYQKTKASVRAFVVRKVPKTHGIQDLIAGSVKKGDRVLIVDDVVTGGDSTIKAIEGARAAGLIVERVIALVDRNEADGQEHIEAMGVKFEALCTLPELITLSDDPDKSATRSTDQKRLASGQSPSIDTAG
jgi:orotate phosphoribosyltransferase